MTKSAKARARKARITVSVSPETVDLLHDIQARVRSPSMSALIEKIVDDLRGKTELEDLESKMKAHYDHMSEGDREEEAAWGKLGESALASLEATNRLRSTKRRR
jgi:hypothetical protein